MNINELKEIAGNDVKIDRNDIIQASVETPMIEHKWCDMIEYHKRQLFTKSKEYEIILASKMLYYKREYKFIPETANELKILLQGDEELVDLKYKMNILSNTIEFMENTLKNIRERVWHIKNINEREKLLSGG